MSETRFTPGPWEIIEDYTGGKDEYYGYFCKVGPFELCMKNADYDAKLISSAPELYEALKSLYEDYKMLADSGDAGFWKLEETEEGKKAISALAKARGEE